MLKQNLSSERILLVLDKVLKLDSTVWNALLGCVRCGKQGSKIIFIGDLTVYKEYKKIGNHETMKPIMLDGFLEDECMLFFREHAFGSADPEDHPELAKMGGKIAKKMNGSIWGAKILGELLRDYLNAPFWSIFLQDGFLCSEFLPNKTLWPVIKTIVQLQPERLKLESLTIPCAESGKLVRKYNEVKSFREVMILGPKYCTPVIEKGKRNRVQFSVVKYFNLYDCTDLIAECEPIGD